MGENIVAAAPPLRGVLSAFRILDSIAPDDQTTQDSESNHPEKISLTKRNEKNKIHLEDNSKLKLFAADTMTVSEQAQHEWFGLRSKDRFFEIAQIRKSQRPLQFERTHLAKS